MIRTCYVFVKSVIFTLHGRILRIGDRVVVEPSQPYGISRVMSYNITLQCGCVVYVACDPKTGLSHTRILETKAQWCPVRRHDIGHRLFLWEILPNPGYLPRPVFVSDGSRLLPI